MTGPGYSCIRAKRTSHDALDDARVESSSPAPGVRTGENNTAQTPP